MKVFLTACSYTEAVIRTYSTEANTGQLMNAATRTDRRDITLSGFKPAYNQTII